MMTAHQPFQHAFDRVIPASFRAHPADWQAARNLTILAALTAVSVPLLTLMYHLLGYDAAGMVVLTAGIVMMIAPFTLNAGFGLAVARDLFITSLFLLKIWMALHFGGMNSPTLPWFLLCPAVAMLVGGVRPGVVWAALAALAVTVLFVLDRAGAIAPAHPISDPQVLRLVCAVGLLAFVTIIIGLAMAGSSEERRQK